MSSDNFDLDIYESGEDIIAVDCSEAQISMLTSATSSFNKNNENIIQILSENKSISLSIAYLQSIFAQSHYTRISPVNSKELLTSLKDLLFGCYSFGKESAIKNLPKSNSQQDLAQYESSIRMKDNEIKKLKEDLTNEKDKFSNLNEEVKKVYQDNSILVRKITKMRDNFDNEMRKLKESLSAKEEENLVLSNKEIQNKHLIKSLEDRYASRKDESESLQQRVTDLKSEVFKKAKTIQNITIAKQKLEASCYEIETKNQKLMIIANKYKSDNLVLKKIAEECSPEVIAEKNKEIEGLRKSISVLNDLYATTFQEKEDISKCLEKTKKLVMKLESYSLSLQETFNEEMKKNNALNDEKRVLEFKEAVESIDIPPPKEDIFMENRNLNKICYSLVKRLSSMKEPGTEEVLTMAKNEIGKLEVCNKPLEDVLKNLEFSKGSDVPAIIASFSELLKKVRAEVNDCKKENKELSEIIASIMRIFSCNDKSFIVDVIEVKNEASKEFFDTLKSLTKSIDYDGVIAYVNFLIKITEQIKKSVFPAFEYSGDIEDFPLFAIQFARTRSVDLEKRHEVDIGIIDAKTKEIEALSKKLSVEESKFNDMAAMNSLYERECKTNRDKLNVLTEKNNEQSNELQQLYSKLDDLETSVNRLTIENENLKNLKNDLSKQVDALSLDKTKLVDRIREKTTKGEEKLKEMIERERTESKKNLEEEKKRNNEREEQLSKELKRIGRQFSKYKKKMESVVSHYAKSSTEQGEMIDRFRRHSEFVDVAKAVSQLDTQDLSLYESTEALTNTIHTLKKEKEEMSNKQQEAAATMNEIVVSRDKFWKLQISDMKNQFEAEIKEKNETIEEISSKLSKLEEFIHSMDPSSNNAIESLNRINENVNSLTRALSKAEDAKEWITWAKRVMLQYNSTIIIKQNSKTIMKLIEELVKKGDSKQIKTYIDTINNLRTQKIIIKKLLTMKEAGDPQKSARPNINSLVIAIMAVVRMKNIK